MLRPGADPHLCKRPPTGRSCADPLSSIRHIVCVSPMNMMKREVQSIPLICMDPRKHTAHSILCFTMHFILKLSSRSHQINEGWWAGKRHSLHISTSSMMIIVMMRDQHEVFERTPIRKLWRNEYENLLSFPTLPSRALIKPPHPRWQIHFSWSTAL